MKNYLVVSYYTDGTGYAKEADGLAHSARIHGIPHFIKSVENRGSWQRNTMYKAEFCKEMLLKFKNKDIVFVDADARFRQYPTLFDQIGGFDLGLCYRDHGKFDHRPGIEHKELLSGTIYFGNQLRVIAFIDLWIAYNKANPGTWEQKNMARALKNHQAAMAKGGLNGYLKLFILPPTYCQIFDLMREAGKPVIEQMQASRRLRHKIGGAKSDILTL